MTGAQLKAFRKRYGFLQLAFAKRLGIHPITLSRWESEDEKVVPAPLLNLALRQLESDFRAEGLKPVDDTPKKPSRPKKPKPKK